MPQVHEEMSTSDHNEVKFFRDKATGLRGIIGIHDTTLGPAAGGTRRYAFDNEAEALKDVLRLSRAMTYKYAISGINMGGGKGVIWVEDDNHNTEELYRSYGRIVDSFDGRFMTGGDVGTSADEMRWISMETDYIIGLPEQFDHPEGYHGGGLGVVRAMEACCDLAYDDDRELADLHVAIQGAGDMGEAIIRYLDQRGAQVTLGEVDDAQADRMEDEYGVDTIAPNDIYEVDCDIFAPCALGFILNDDTIPELRCDIVCGAANNQLDTETQHGQMLHERGILYAPDYLANSGRTIDDTDLLRRGGYNHNRARAMIDQIYDRMIQIGKRSETEDRPTYAIANDIASERIEAMRSSRPKVHETRRPQW